MEQEKLNKIDDLSDLADFATKNMKLDTIETDIRAVIWQAFSLGIYRERLDHLSEACKWQSVNEFLPKEGQRVGIVTRDGAMYFGCMFNGSFPKNVTHWLDIPEIPK